MNSFTPIVLSPLSMIYGAVTRTRLSLYRRGTFRTATLNRPVISVGNLTTGGTGKTPLVEWVARVLAEHGKNVCILTRGYGRANSGRRILVSDKQTVFSSATEAGDEAFLLAKKLKGIASVVSDADRVSAGEGAIKHLGVDCFVLDDGFQHLRLARDLNIVTVDATNPWGNGSLLPYGRLREPINGLRRADCVVITRTDQSNNIPSLISEITRLTDGRPVFLSHMRVTGTAHVSGEAAGSQVDSRRTAAFCGVGNPNSFFTQVRNAGYDIVLEKDFMDHHSYSQKDIDDLVKRAKQAGADSLITTAKDAVKLQSLTFAIPCYVLEIEISVENSESLKALILAAAR